MKTLVVPAALVSMASTTSAFTSPLVRPSFRSVAHQSVTPVQAFPRYDKDENKLDRIFPDKEVKKKFNNPEPALLSLFKESLIVNALAPSALALLLSFSLLTASPEAALAARSGGRMGGSFGSAAPQMRSAPSRSYGGGGGGYYGGGYRSGVTVAPIITPYYSPPIMYGGPGIMAVPRGPSIFDLLFFGTFGFILLNAFTSTARGIASSGTNLFTDSTTSVLGDGVTVAKLSVALEVPNRDDSNSILSVLDRLAKTAETDSRVGIQDLTSTVAVELLRRKSSIVSAHSESQHFRDKSKGQREYSLSAVKERGKFEEETVSKYGGVDYSSGKRSSRGDAGSATMAVVTIVFAIDGDQTKIPKIRSISDVENALRRIASDSKVEDCLQSAEILWTPEARDETLTLRDVIADYPELMSV